MPSINVATTGWQPAKRQESQVEWTQKAIMIHRTAITKITKIKGRPVFPTAG